jgi:hypothetical protein
MLRRIAVISFTVVVIAGLLSFGCSQDSIPASPVLGDGDDGGGDDLPYTLIIDFEVTKEGGGHPTFQFQNSGWTIIDPGPPVVEGEMFKESGVNQVYWRVVFKHAGMGYIGFISRQLQATDPPSPWAGESEWVLFDLSWYKVEICNARAELFYPYAE